MSYAVALLGILLAIVLILFLDICEVNIARPVRAVGRWAYATGRLLVHLLTLNCYRCLWCHRWEMVYGRRVGRHEKCPPF